LSWQKQLFVVPVRAIRLTSPPNGQRCFRVSRLPIGVGFGCLPRADFTTSNRSPNCHSVGGGGRTLTCMMATAQVSPKSIWMAVEVTGARSNGHNSRMSGRCTSWSVASASLHPGCECTPTSFAPFACCRYRLDAPVSQRYRLPMTAAAAAARRRQGERAHCQADKALMERRCRKPRS